MNSMSKVPAWLHVAEWERRARRSRRNARLEFRRVLCMEPSELPRDQEGKEREKKIGGKENEEKKSGVRFELG